MASKPLSIKRKHFELYKSLNLGTNFMLFDCYTSTKKDTDEALKEIVQQISSPPDLLMVYGTAPYDWNKVRQVLSEHFSSKTQIVGATSCLGILTNKSFCSNEGYALGVIALSDFSGDIGVGSCFTGSAQEKTRKACEQLLENAQRKGEMPDFIWVLNSPGNEEEVLEEIVTYFDSEVKTFGGSSADNDISGQWQLIHNNASSAEGVVLVGFFSPDDQIVSLFHSGYAPTLNKAIVTKSEGREVIELDNKPALDVYNYWIGGNLSQEIQGEEKSILGESTLHPLGRVSGVVKDIPYYLLSHPNSITKRKGITLFTNIQEGEEVTLMKGNIESLQKRLAEVVNTLMKREGLKKEDLAGALIVYCAGCMLAVNGQGLMNSVAEKLYDVIGETPLLGIHTFGEQGNFFENDKGHHGNLMISATLFKR